MKRHMLACAALLFAACGGPAGEQGGQEPETRTEVTYGERIALVKPDLKAGLTINEAAVRGANTMPEHSRLRSFLVYCGPLRA